MVAVKAEAPDSIEVILEKVRSLGPGLRERAVEAERAGRVSDQTIAELGAPVRSRSVRHENMAVTSFPLPNSWRSSPRWRSGTVRPPGLSGLGQHRTGSASVVGPKLPKRYSQQAGRGPTLELLVIFPQPRGALGACKTAGSSAAALGLSLAMRYGPHGATWASWSRVTAKPIWPARKFRVMSSRR